MLGISSDITDFNQSMLWMLMQSYDIGGITS